MLGGLPVGGIFALGLPLAVLASIHLVSADEPAVAKGERTYENYCATCHCDRLVNNSAGLTYDLRRLGPDEHSRFVDSVQNGKNKMPPWKGVLDDIQIEQLWAYIQASIPRLAHPTGVAPAK